MILLRKLLAIWLCAVVATVVASPIGRNGFGRDGLGATRRIQDSDDLSAISARLFKRGLSKTRKLLTIQLCVVLGFLAIFLVVGALLWKRYTRAEAEEIQEEGGPPRNFLSPLQEDPDESVEKEQKKATESAVKEPRRVQLHDSAVQDGSEWQETQTQSSGNIPIMMSTEAQGQQPTTQAPVQRPVSPVSPVSPIEPEEPVIAYRPGQQTWREGTPPGPPRTNGGMI